MLDSKLGTVCVAQAPSQCNTQVSVPVHAQPDPQPAKQQSKDIDTQAEGTGYDVHAQSKMLSKDGKSAGPNASSMEPATPQQPVDRRQVQGGHSSSDDSPGGTISFEPKVLSLDAEVLSMDVEAGGPAASPPQSARYMEDIDTQQSAALLKSSSGAGTAKGFDSIAYRALKIKDLMGMDPSAVLELQAAEWRHAFKEEGVEISEEEAMGWAVKTRDQEKQSGINPLYAADSQSMFVMEPTVNEDDFLGSTKWLNSDGELAALEEFKDFWLGMPLPTLGDEVDDNTGRDPAWRRETLALLFSMTLNDA